jgi:cobyrinic acid a,c-diamide synthase
LVVAGTASGVGKTTIATGLMAALRRRGTRVAAAKVGPDFIDPGYHALATGRPGRNLDPWMCGEAVIPALAARAAHGADILIIEGVMGLFDGAGATWISSTAHVARLLAAPVVLVVDASAMSASVAAVVHGFATFDPTVTITGVVLNRVGSDRHEALLREAMSPLPIPILGVLRRDDSFTWRDRHLGLIPVVERPDDVRRSLDRLADAVAAAIDLDLVARVAAKAPVRATEPLAAPRPASPPAPRPPILAVPPVAPVPAVVAVPAVAPGTAGRCRIAVAAGAAFSFGYADNLEMLAEAGAELVPFDPLHEPALPKGIGGLIVGGGFPEVYAAALADNLPLLADTRRRVGEGLVTWAECGGLLWLSQDLDGHRLCGVINARGVMTDRLTLGYRTATFLTATPLGPAGTTVRGHEFHYSTVEPAGDALTLEGAAGRETAFRSGWGSPTLMASYLHLHLAGAPQLATEMVAKAAAAALALPS